MYEYQPILGSVDPSLLPQGSPNMRPNWKQALSGLANNPDLAMALLANSGYSQVKRPIGEVLGTSMLQAQQMQRQRQDDEFKRKYMEAQIAAMNGRDTQKQPSSVQEYEYAKQNGFKGSFQDWTVAAGQSSRPSSVLEWEHYNSLLEGDKKNGTQNARLYLEMKRNPNFKVQDIQGSPTVVTGTPGGGVQTTALSTPQAEIAAAAARKGAEAEAGTVGTGKGTIIADIQKKGANAKVVMDTLDIADNLIDASTGSLVGAGADRLAGVFGVAPKGAQASAQLKVLQAGLMLNMPRMEGPQSDRDVELYRQAAASLGDDTVPNEIKKAAVQTIRNIQNTYMQRAKQPYQINPAGSPEDNQARAAEFNNLLDKYAPRK